ncbi:MAG: hypothetical protein ACXWUH_05700 [Burkholderiales bacterium]
MSRDTSKESMCDECGALLRDPWTVTAHEALKDGAAQVRPQGMAQMFTCASCGTRWERFRRKVGASAAAVWRTL